MFKDIKKLFPDAIIQGQPMYHSEYTCFYDDASKQYLSIPMQSMTIRERALLESMFAVVEQLPSFLNHLPSQKNWYNFIMDDGNLPHSETRIRFIHFSLQDANHYQDFLEAIDSFFQEQITLIWLDTKSGAIIEHETTDSLSSIDYLSFKEAILSDFYFEVDFYLGRFYDATPFLKEQFLREQYYFRMIRTMNTKQHIFTFTTTFPFVIMATSWEQLRPILKEESKEIFQEDWDLLTTIKTYLENNLNTSLTAKQLYMHRNSLQYKIDKFIERTSIDIKEFQGALSTYFICMYSEAFYFHQDFHD